MCDVFWLERRNKQGAIRPNGDVRSRVRAQLSHYLHHSTFAFIFLRQTHLRRESTEQRDEHSEKHGQICRWFARVGRISWVESWVVGGQAWSRHGAGRTESQDIKEALGRECRSLHWRFSTERSKRLGCVATHSPTTEERLFWPCSRLAYADTYVQTRHFATMRSGPLLLDEHWL